MDKQGLRALMREREKEFSAEQAAAEASEILRRVESLPAFARARTILLYMSMPGEVPTKSFIDKWASSKRIVLPLVKGDELELREYDPAKLREGYRGILEPSDDCAPIDPSEIDFALVPGVAFDGNNRLGRGKGFYDRLLPRLRCPAYGAAFSFRIVDKVPADPWDAPLKVIKSTDYL